MAISPQSRGPGRKLAIGIVHTLALLLINHIIQANCASFYGLGYIRLPIHESKNSTNIEFRFKTHQLTAFLFLAAGTSDYCFVYLENGQLAVRINFGYGETYLASESVPLNDLRWHTVKLIQIKRHLSLTIDQKSTFVHRVATEHTAMTIKYGIFLGGQDANFKSLYLGNVHHLRGCLDLVQWNGRNILSESAKQGIWHGVSASVCDEEFTASANSTISYTDAESSFLLLPGLMEFAPNHTEESMEPLTIQFDVKTISTTALLMFNPGDNPYRAEYFAVQLIEKRVVVLISDGATQSRIESNSEVSGANWHHVEITLDPGGSELSLSLDGKVNKTKSYTRLDQRQFSPQLFVGGVSQSQQSLALNYRLQSVLLEPNVSLRGCIRNIRINGKNVGIRNAIATNQIKTGKCKWHFVCADLERSPCVEGAQCVQMDVANVKCVCEGTHTCVKSHFKHKTITAMSEKRAICNQHLPPVNVLEGSSSTTLAATRPSTSSASRFILHKLPQFGAIEDVRSKSEPNIGDVYFWNDLTSLRYSQNRFQHGINDSLVFRVVDEENEKGSCQRILTIPIQIKPSNDAPNRQKSVIRIRMIQNSRKLILPNTLKAKQREFKSKKKPEDRIYKVIKIEGNNQSYFESQSEPNVPIVEFSDEDLKSQSIGFVHVSEENSTNVEVTLLVKNGDRAEQEYRLIIEPYEMDIGEESNTGLVMTHNTFAPITSANLSYSSNNIAVRQEQSQLIKYETLSGPSFGAIQKLRSISNHWVNVTHFTQRHIDRGKVRYVHSSGGSPTSDRVQIRVSFYKQMISTFWFPVKFVTNIRIVEMGYNHCNLSENDKEIIITKQELSYQTEPIATMPEKILISLVSGPSNGALYLINADGLQNKLSVQSKFTQKDVEENRLLYVKNSSSVEFANKRDQMDWFELRVSLSGHNVSRVSQFNINIKQVIHKYILINNEIAVLEGERITIDRNSLYLITENDDYFDSGIVFNITRQPKLGSIRLLSVDHKEILESNPARIPQKLIREQRVAYEHDDSETDFDYFEFTVINSTDQIVSSGKFVIRIQMVNDNPPVQVGNKTLEVIRHGERTLHKSDLHYQDKDMGTNTSSIVYTKIFASNGHFYSPNKTLIDRFSQEDVDNGLVVFKHSGNDDGQIRFVVTDGKHLVPGLLAVKASNPFITVASVAGISVRYGENSLISSSNLTIKTNLANSSEIIIKAITEPMFGQILVNDKPNSQFTLQELENNLVEYESTVFEDEIPQSKNDSFEFRLLNKFGIMQKSYEFPIRIYPQSYFNIRIVHLKNLTVVEGQEVVLDPGSLLVEHSELKPSEIIFKIIRKPKNGIVRNLNPKTFDPPVFVQENLQFSQQDINDGYVVYQSVNLHSPSDVVTAVQYWDSFLFDVGNAIVRQPNVSFNIELIPKLITIETNNMTVTEGQTVILTNHNLYISHPYYIALIDEFIVVEEPKYGTVSLISQDNVKISAKSFTVAQLNENLICYEHDSSEVTRDWFTVVARSNSLDKESLPATIHITIISVNDEWPQIVNSSDAEVWVNTSVQITNQHLASIDDDSTASEITYTVSTPINGYLIESESNTTIDRFTQEDIDLGKVYFVHVGSEDGSFRYQVSDGRNGGLSGLFNIRVKARKMKMEVNQKLLVTPGMQQSITRRHLMVTTEDLSEEQEFTYRVIKAPTFGRLMLETFKNGHEKLNNFTQRQINENLVLYEQNVPITSPIVTDRAIFDVESPNISTLKSVYFAIEIAIESFKNVIPTNSRELIQIRPLKVDEGKFKVLSENEINMINLRSQIKSEEKIFLKITTFPVNGIILRSGASIESDHMIPLAALLNQSLVYKHDDSNTFNDSIEVNLYLVESFAISVVNFTLPIEVIPVINRIPRLKAISGMKTLVSQQVLSVRDNDGLESNIIYQIRSDNNSRDGYFIVDPSDQPVTKFTQSDINENRVYFVNNGKVSQHTFWFRVKDDHSIVCNANDHIDFPFEQLIKSVSNSHCSQYYPFQINVIQLSIELVNHTSVQLLQSTFEAPITSHNLRARSHSGDTSHLLYRVTKGPFHGQITVNNKSDQLEFSQREIDTNVVSYRQTNFSAKDYFLVDVIVEKNSHNEKFLYDINVQVEIKPLIRATKPFLIANPGSQSLLSYEYLDASELALKTNSNPKFRILKELKYGVFKMLRFGEMAGEGPGDVIYEFTHDHIIRNRVAYVPKASLATYDEILIEVVSYELSARNVQNAHGVFVVNIVKNGTFEEIHSGHSYHEGFLRALGIELSRETLLIVFTVCVCIILLLALVGVIRMCQVHMCRPRHSCHKNDSVKTLPHHGNLDNSSRDYSNNSSLKQTDCSIRSSSSSPFDQANLFHVDVPSISPSIAKRFERINLEHDLDNYSGQLLFMRCENDKLHDLSPLPPPSLYFVNDNPSSPEEPQPFYWNKPQFETTGQPKKTGDFRHRSSGDGTSGSTSPHCSSKQKLKNKSMNELTDFEQYLPKVSSKQDEMFCTLDNRKHKVKTTHTQVKNQYWI